jgi:hypothetical protein
MKPFTKTLYGRNHRYPAPEHTRVPKSSNDRDGTRSAKRQENEKIICNSIESNTNKKILDVFHQEADDGIPSHWCVQYFKTDGAGFVECKYFDTWTEANEYAMKYGYND